MGDHVGGYVGSHRGGPSGPREATATVARTDAVPQLRTFTQASAKPWDLH